MARETAPALFDDEHMQHTEIFRCNHRLAGPERLEGASEPREDLEPALLAVCGLGFRTSALLRAHEAECARNPATAAGQGRLDDLRKEREEAERREREEKERKEKEERDRAEREERERLEAEERARQEAEEAARKEREEAEAAALKEAEEEEARVAAQALADAAAVDAHAALSQLLQCPPDVDPGVWAALPDEERRAIAGVEEGEDGDSTANASSPEAAGTGAALAPGSPRCPPGYDHDVFASLPDFMQEEILEEHRRTVAAREGDSTNDNVRQLVEAAGFDMETFQSLPETIREELLGQARLDHPELAGNGGGATSGGDAAENNASFLTSLAPELRAEVLLTADADFLATLPPEFAAEAQMHRERAASDWQRAERRGQLPAGNDAAAGQIQFDNDGDEYSTDYSDEEDGDGEGEIDARRRYASESESRDAALAAMVRTDGRMWLPNDDLLKPSVPLPLLATLMRVITSASSRLQVSFALVRGVLQHVSKHAGQRDLTLRLLSGVLSGDNIVLTAAGTAIEADASSSSRSRSRSSSNATVSSSSESRPRPRLQTLLQEARECAAEASASVANGAALPMLKTASLLSSSSSSSSNNNNNSNSNSNTVGDNDSQRIDKLSPAALRAASRAAEKLLVDRVVALLAALTDGNDSIRYDLLRPRLRDGEVSSKAEAIADPVRDDPASDPVVAKSAAAKDKELERKEERHAGNIAVVVCVSQQHEDTADSTANTTPAPLYFKLRRRMKMKRLLRAFAAQRKVPACSVRLLLEVPPPSLQGGDKEDSNEKEEKPSLRPVDPAETARVLGLESGSRFVAIVDEEAARRHRQRVREREQEETSVTKAPPPGQSTHSLLEVVIGTLNSASGNSAVVEDQGSLLSVARLVRAITAPYENLSNPNPNLSAAAGSSDSAGAAALSVPALGPLGTLSTSPSDTAAPVSTEETAVDVEEALAPGSDSAAAAAAATATNKKEKRKGHILTPVPPVGLSRESLTALCDVLRADACSQEVFDCMEKAISRVARVSSNQAILHSLLVEVVDDLALVAKGQLVQFSCSLGMTAVAARRTRPSAPSSPVAAGAGDAESSNNINSGNSGTASGVSRARVTASQLPLIQASSRHFERLHRSLLTLHAMSRKTDRRLLSSIVLSPALGALWDALESTTYLLKMYLVDAEVPAGTGGGAATAALGAMGANRSQEQAALTSVLTSLLPLLESFLLAHACDLEATAPAANGGASDANNSSTALAASATRPGEPVLPGARYRDSEAYAAMHQPLFAEQLQHETASTTSAASPRVRTGSSDGGGNLDMPSPPSLNKVTSLSRVPSMRRQGSAVLHLAPGTTITPALARAQRLLAFVQAHSGALNLLISSQPQLLEGGPFSALIKVPQLRSHLNFENKRKYFLHMLRERGGRRQRRMVGPHLQLRRDNVFEDSFNQLRSRSSDEMRGKLQVNFHGEEGVDAGGLTREWYVLCSIGLPFFSCL
jgi:hypothetical protein